jgi:hypothetical protein
LVHVVKKALQTIIHRLLLLYFRTAKNHWKEHIKVVCCLTSCFDCTYIATPPLLPNGEEINPKNTAGSVPPIVPVDTRGNIRSAVPKPDPQLRPHQPQEAEDPVPKSIGNWTHIRVLNLLGNVFIGRIPSGICDASNLTSLSAHCISALVCPGKYCLLGDYTWFTVVVDALRIRQKFDCWGVPFGMRGSMLYLSVCEARCCTFRYARFDAIYAARCCTFRYARLFAMCKVRCCTFRYARLSQACTKMNKVFFVRVCLVFPSSPSYSCEC